MMFASNPLQLCNLIPIVHRDNLRGDRNQWAYDLDNRVKASDHIGICNVMGAPAGYFPLAGIIVGATAALVYVSATELFAPGVAILLSMSATLLLTGAL